MKFSFILLRLRAFSWLTKALAKRYQFSLFLGFSLGLFFFLTLIFAYPFFRAHFKQPPVKKIGFIGNYTPTSFPLKIQNLVSIGLTNLTPQGEATAAAAAHWEVDDEGKIYTFFLNRGLLWQDGKKFTAWDVNYNLRDAEISVLDDFTLQIKLKEPFSPLPVLLSQPLFKEGLTGLGCYEIDSLTVKKEKLTKLTLKPCDLKSGLAILKYHFYPSEEEAILAYKLGEIGFIEGLNDLAPLQGWPVKVEAKIVKDHYVGVFYNTEDEFLGQKNVRQALTYALPDLPFGKKIVSPIHTDSWAYNESLKGYESDPKLGQKLLFSGKESTNSAKRRIVLSATRPHQELAEKIVAAWRDLGIPAEVKIEKEVPAEFQALLAVQEIPPDPDQYSLWHSMQKKTNITHYKNPRIDKLLEDGRTIVSSAERRKKYLDFQKYLLDDVPVAFLYYPMTYTISRH